MSEEIIIPEKKDLGDLLDMIDESVEKIAFLEDFVSRATPDRELYSEDGRLGFIHILANLQRELRFVSDQISEKCEKNLIIDKTEQS